jgi:hypothetical protein
MLIWKVIAANPGIDRAGIWAKIERQIPEGYALRSYERYRETSGGRLAERGASPQTARRFVLTKALANMRQLGTVTAAGTGDKAAYTVARPPRYLDNAEAVDETGTRLADHMALVEACRTIERMLARAEQPRLSLAERAAVSLLVSRMRAGQA